MNETSNRPDTRPDPSRLTVRLAGLAVALLPLIPARTTVEPGPVVMGPVAEVVDTSAQDEVDVVVAEPAATVPERSEGPGSEDVSPVRGDGRAGSGPGSVHVQAGAVRVIQD